MNNDLKDDTVSDTEPTTPRVANPTGAELDKSKPDKPLAKRARNWGILAVVLVAVGLWGYRWAGTGMHEGVVQRVYEKEGSMRVELEMTSGEVRVFENHDQGFPYFKRDAADMQAMLHRMARSGDLVQVTTWGFRSSLASAFPNVVKLELRESAIERRRARAERVADSVLRTLSQKNALSADPKQVREDVVQAVERGLKKSAR